MAITNFSALSDRLVRLNGSAGPVLLVFIFLSIIPYPLTFTTAYIKWNCTTIQKEKPCCIPHGLKDMNSYASQPRFEYLGR